MAAFDGVNFTSWQRSPIYDLVKSAALNDGRLSGEIPIALTDAADGQTVQRSASFHIHGPGDINTIDLRRILRRVPRADSSDAETTKMVHIDFSDPTIPWQYSPVLASGAALRPWIALLVGTDSEIVVHERNATVQVAPAVLADLDLAQSHRWAFVQDEAGHGEIARLICPHRSEQASKPNVLVSDTKHLAVVVKAFDRAGRAAWQDPVGAPVTLELLHWWTFRTGDSGDFETLATAIRPRDADGLGRAPVRYERGGLSVGLYARGAISNLAPDTDDEKADVEKARVDLADLGADVAALEQGDPLGRKVISLPQYGAPWAADPRSTTWGRQLNDDARLRGTAGIGVSMGQAAQDELVAAVVAELGALPLAAHLVANLAFGLSSATSLWERHLPTDPTRQVDLLSPIMRRLRATNGTAMKAITGPDSPLDRALFSSAARRALRPGTARTRHSAGPVTRHDVLVTANTCPIGQVASSKHYPSIDNLAERLGAPPAADILQIRQLPPEVLDAMDRLVGVLVNPDDPRYLESEQRLVDAVAATLDVTLDPHQSLRSYTRLPLSWSVLVSTVIRLLPVSDIFDPLELTAVLVEILTRYPVPRPSRCSAPNLSGVAGAVTTALDPRRPDAPARRRIGARIRGIGIGDLRPLEYPAGVDYATWILLRDRAKEWLLPGVGTLEKNAVVAMQTNPSFIDCFLIGLNTQLQNELHWRNIPIDRSGTPLLTFWRRVDYTTGERVTDIRPIDDWAPDSNIGSTDHQAVAPDDLTGNNDLVIVFRTDLFRRYPKTMVYLVRTTTDPGDLNARLLQTPTLSYPVGTNRDDREFIGPNFQGNIDTDIVFFSFDISPPELDQFWLILDEPPSQLRFRKYETNQQLPPNPLGDAATTSAAFANATLDKPTRVAFDGKELLARGLTL